MTPLVLAAVVHLNITLIQVNEHDIQDFCPPPAVACYVKEAGIIYYRQPYSFYDYERLEALGHEICHAINYQNSADKRICAPDGGD